MWGSMNVVSFYICPPAHPPLPPPPPTPLKGLHSALKFLNLPFSMIMYLRCVFLLSKVCVLLRSWNEGCLLGSRCMMSCWVVPGANIPWLVVDAASTKYNVIVNIPLFCNFTKQEGNSNPDCLPRIAVVAMSEGGGRGQKKFPSQNVVGSPKMQEQMSFSPMAAGVGDVFFLGGGGGGGAMCAVMNPTNLMWLRCYGDTTRLVTRTTLVDQSRSYTIHVYSIIFSKESCMVTLLPMCHKLPGFLVHKYTCIQELVLTCLPWYCNHCIFSY